MKLKNASVFIITLATIFLFSCESKKEQNELINSDKSPKKDSVLILKPESIEVTPSIINVAALLSKITNTDSILYKLDSAEVEWMATDEWKEKSTLTSAEVRYLSTRFMKNALIRGGLNAINDFMQLDSLRLNGEYEEYIDNIDIGMTVTAEANIGDKVKISENSFILLWAIYIATYEACPYYTGTSVYGTLFIDQTATSTAVLGETSSAGDAPYWMLTFITSEITNSVINTVIAEENGGEYDEENDIELTESSETKCVIKITDDGFKIKRENP